MLLPGNQSLIEPSSKPEKNFRPYESQVTPRAFPPLTRTFPLKATPLALSALTKKLPSRMLKTHTPSSVEKFGSGPEKNRSVPQRWSKKKSRME
jgi:hypothetical protein